MDARGDHQARKRIAPLVERDPLEPGVAQDLTLRSVGRGDATCQPVIVAEAGIGAGIHVLPGVTSRGLAGRYRPVGRGGSGRAGSGQLLVAG
jgi:hypothetical protein